MPSPKAMIIPVTPFQQNCCLLWDDDSKQAVVVDPGGDVPAILDAIKQAGVKVGEIWLTHGHIDHAGGAAELAEALSVPVIGPSKEDLQLLEALPETGLKYGMTDARKIVPQRWLAQGDTVSVGGLTFEVRFCPGHTPGHIIFYNEAMKFALVGDVLFQGSVGRTDMPYGSHDTLIHSIRTQLLTLPDEVSFLCGHGSPSTIGAERRSNPFLQ
jgi:glyoxylase-like metal-dependent hydrolase (beta-lactamase superfamily II)